MVQSILVPLDGSRFGEHALPLARQIARRAGAVITLAHVHVPLINVSIGEWNLGGVPIVDERMDAEQREYERAYLESLRTRFADDALNVTCAVIDGPVVPALTEYATTIEADLVVMTTHGHGALSRVWLGSVADACVRHSEVPVLLIRPTTAAADTSPPANQPWTFRRMLIPLDGSALAERILEPACRLGDLLGVEYWLLRVVQPVAGNSHRWSRDVGAIEQALIQSWRSEAQAYLDRIAVELRAQGRTVHTAVAVAHQPARAILDAAQHDAIDLLALATHGRGGLSRLLLGSTADKVVRGAEMPVLLVHPDMHQQVLPDA